MALEAAARWKALYELSRRYREMAPWEWMGNNELFGVRDPETGETGYCSVIGALGEGVSSPKKEVDGVAFGAR
ncbi:MAG: hypothetical protein AB1776_04915 [Bacillota bacterium]